MLLPLIIFPPYRREKAAQDLQMNSTPHLLKLTQVCFDYVKIHQKWFLLIFRL